MLKKSLFAVALVAMLAGMSLAGEIKVHDWPVSWEYEFQQITTIPVTMDVGYWLNIKDQDKLKIHLTQDSIHTYSGCTTMKVQCNFDVALKATIESTGKIGGTYKTTLSTYELASGGGDVEVCAQLTKANLGDQPAKTKQTVAHVTIWVAPVPGSDAGGTIWAEG